MVNLIDSNKKSIILFKPSGTIAISGDLSEIQRKFYDGLLFNIKQELDNSRNNDIFFSVPLKELKKLLSTDELNKNNTYYKNQLKKLSKIQIEYNILGKDKIIEGFANLVTEGEFVIDKKTGEVVFRYNIPTRVKNAIQSQRGLFAKIDLMIKKNLKHRYSLILYDLIKDYQKVEIPEMSISEFRKIFGIKDKYKLFQDLRKRVIDPAVNEININKEIDFLVSYELKKVGPKYTHIKFNIKPKPAKLKLNQQTEKILQDEVSENADLKELLVLIPKDYRESKKVVSLILGGLEEKGKEYTQAQIKYTNKHAKNNYVAYLKNAIEKDYAAVEVVEGVAVEDDNEWKKKYIGKKIKLQGKEDVWEIVFVDEPEEGEKCRVRVKNEEGIEVWAVIKINNPLLD